MVSLGLRVLVVSARGCDFTLWTVSALPVRSCVLPSRLSLSGRPRRPAGRRGGPPAPARAPARPAPARRGRARRAGRQAGRLAAGPGDRRTSGHCVSLY